MDFANLFIDLSGKQPASVAEAKEQGLPVLAYGAFINEIIGFLIIAFVIFLVIRQVNKMKREPEPTTRDCPFCLTPVPLAATRCAACCAELPASA